MRPRLNQKVNLRINTNGTTKDVSGIIVGVYHSMRKVAVEIDNKDYSKCNYDYDLLYMNDIIE